MLCRGLITKLGNIEKAFSLLPRRRLTTSILNTSMCIAKSCNLERIVGCGKRVGDGEFQFQREERLRKCSTVENMQEYSQNVGPGKEIWTRAEISK